MCRSVCTLHDVHDARIMYNPKTVLWYSLACTQPDALAYLVQFEHLNYLKNCWDFAYKSICGLIEHTLVVTNI